MQLELGKIYEGKVTGIKEYGAFVEILDEDKNPTGVTGMVHISQISNEYVSNANDVLSEGQIVNVKYIGTNEQSKIKLSIKETLPQEPKRNNYQRHNNGNYNSTNGYQKRNGGSNNSYRRNGYAKNNSNNNSSSYSGGAFSDNLFNNKKSENDSFEDMLSKFKQSSDENLNDLKKITDRRNRTRRK